MYALVFSSVYLSIYIVPCYRTGVRKPIPLRIECEFRNCEMRRLKHSKAHGGSPSKPGVVLVR